MCPNAFFVRKSWKPLIHSLMKRREQALCTNIRLHYYGGGGIKKEKTIKLKKKKKKGYPIKVQ